MVLFSLIAVMYMNLPSNGQQYVVEKSPIVISIEQKVLTDCTEKVKPCCDLPINRINKQAIILLLPLEGTTSYATLYKSEDYAKNKKKSENLEYLRKKQDAKNIPDGQPLTLNLTSLDDGEYIVVYKTDTLFVLIKIILSTKK